MHYFFVYHAAKSMGQLKGQECSSGVGAGWGGGGGILPAPQNYTHNALGMELIPYRVPIVKIPIDSLPHLASIS